MKNITALALVMILCASMLVGCGCSSDMAVTTTPTTEATTVPTTAAPTTEATMAPTTEPATVPTTMPNTTPATDGIMDDMTVPEGTMDTDRGTVPDDSTNGARGRRLR